MQLRVSTQTHCFHVDNIPSISYPCVNWLQKLGNAERIRTSYTARMTIKGIWVTENSTIYGTVGFNYSSWQRSSAEWKKRHLCSLRGERSHERLVIRRTRRETGRAIIFFFTTRLPASSRLRLNWSIQRTVFALLALPSSQTNFQRSDFVANDKRNKTWNEWEAKRSETKIENWKKEERKEYREAGSDR